MQDVPYSLMPSASLRDREGKANAAAQGTVTGLLRWKRLRSTSGAAEPTA